MRKTKRRRRRRPCRGRGHPPRATERRSTPTQRLQEQRRCRKRRRRTRGRRRRVGRHRRVHSGAANTTATTTPNGQRRPVARESVAAGSTATNGRRPPAPEQAVAAEAESPVESGRQHHDRVAADGVDGRDRSSRIEMPRRRSCWRRAGRWPGREGDVFGGRRRSRRRRRLNRGALPPGGARRAITLDRAWPRRPWRAPPRRDRGRHRQIPARLRPVAVAEDQLLQRRLRVVCGERQRRRGRGQRLHRPEHVAASPCPSSPRYSPGDRRQLGGGPSSRRGPARQPARSTSARSR